MPIVLNSVTQVDKLSVINDNFQKIEDAVNSSLLWRNGNTAGEAQMTRPLDMNNGQILNALVGNLRLSELGEDLTSSVVSAANSAISANNSAIAATGAATSASSSASAAASSAASVSGLASQIATNTSDISSLSTRMTTEENKVNDIAHGGTNANTAAGARTQLGAAASGANTDITSITGSAASLTTARTVQTNLASTSSASFNGTANISPGVTGTLALGNGGTGATTAATALSNLGGTPLTGITTAPAAGVVGEVLEVTGTDVSLTTSTFTTAISLSLTPGVWEVTGNVSISGSAAVVIAYNVGISTTAGASAGFPRAVSYSGPAITQQSNALPAQRLVLTSTTTVFLISWANFASGTCTTRGFIHAHRVR